MFAFNEMKTVHFLSTFLTHYPGGSGTMQQ
uniref:Uncharacterized protein n=1 Tax=Anguilla anguilla TaxID=7936 RepID=A0A0E9VKC2_ANGAN